MANRVGPCEPWATLEEVRNCPGGCADEGMYDDDKLEAAITSASEILFMLSGRQFSGVCESVVRPHGTCRCSGYGWRDGLRCPCAEPPQIVLGVPLVEVDEVKIDGVVLPESEYRIDDQRYLVRLVSADGQRRGWPCCQDLRVPTTELRTFEVTFSYGQVPPQTGKDAAKVLACEIAKSCTPGVECRFDRSVQTISRQGVSIQLPGLIDVIKEGRTGIPEVDLFILAFNPAGIKQRARVFSPDFKSPIRHAGTS